MCIRDSLHQWGSAGGGNGQFNYPYDVAVDGAGNVYVGEGLLAHRIQKFDGDGNYLDQWGSEGSGAVSYTHLDVYKRQALEPTATLLSPSIIF